jgi:hypothetical protein
MEPQARAYFVNAVLVFVPDLIVGWAAARLTDSGWYGFFITLIALQAIYFFSRFKKALWAWLLFWIYRKRQMAAYLENYFIDSHFPVPDEFTTDLDGYLSEISNNTFNGFKTAGRVSMVLQLNSAAQIAMKRYARLANRFAQRLTGAATPAA